MCMSQSWVNGCVRHYATVAHVQVARLRMLGADLVLYGEDCVEAEIEARQIAENAGSTYISPYNDWEVSTLYWQ